MKRWVTLIATAVVVIGMSGIASAQGRRGGGPPAMTGGGRPAMTGEGRPAMTGLEHAEATANSNGQRGIENAEAKQAAQKDQNKDKDKGKAKAKGKNKKHKHSQ